MTLPVRLTSAAACDLALAERWYFDEAPHVLASFEEEIDRAFGLISERPELYPTVESTVRRALRVAACGARERRGDRPAATPDAACHQRRSFGWPRPTVA